MKRTPVMFFDGARAVPTVIEQGGLEFVQPSWTLERATPCGLPAGTQLQPIASAPEGGDYRVCKILHVPAPGATQAFGRVAQAHERTFRVSEGWATRQDGRVR